MKSPYRFDKRRRVWYDQATMAALPKALYTPEEFLALDRAAELKSEYHAGETFAMEGASENHDTIAVNVLTELGARLKRRPCRPFSSDMRVQIPAADRLTYPA